METQNVVFEITQSRRGINVKIWEPAPMDQEHHRPFSFVANYRVKSVVEAREILKEYDLLPDKVMAM